MTFDSAVNVATLVAILAFGWRTMRHVHLIEFRVDQLWRWWEKETDRGHDRRWKDTDR